MNAQRKKLTVTMGPTLLGEIQLPLHLRGDGVFFGVHQKRGAIGDWQRRKCESSSPNMTFL
jgi:hypothetical protein